MYTVYERWSKRSSSQQICEMMTRQTKGCSQSWAELKFSRKTGFSELFNRCFRLIVARLHDFFSSKFDDLYQMQKCIENMPLQNICDNPKEGGYKNQGHLVNVD